VVSIRALGLAVGGAIAATIGAPRPHGPEWAAIRRAADPAPAETSPSSLHARGPSDARRNGRIWLTRSDEDAESLWLRKGVVPAPPAWRNRREFDPITDSGSPDDPVSADPSEDPERWSIVANAPDRTRNFERDAHPSRRVSWSRR
jgi:hypothetical protein